MPDHPIQDDSWDPRASVMQPACQYCGAIEDLNKNDAFEITFICDDCEDTHSNEFISLKGSR